MVHFLRVKQLNQVPEAGGTVHYRDVGDYLIHQEKLDLLAAELA
jgi:predicted helicase